MINSSNQKLLFWLLIRKLFNCLLDLLLCQRMIELDTHNKLIFEYASLTRFLCNWLLLYPKWSISSSSILKIFFASFLPYEICDLTCFCYSFSNQTQMRSASVEIPVNHMKNKKFHTGENEFVWLLLEAQKHTEYLVTIWSQL